MNLQEDIDFMEINQELDRLKHTQDVHECYGTFKCRCGCKQVITCPGGKICRARVMCLKGSEQTQAVREWMRHGLCVCSFVIQNRDRPDMSYQLLLSHHIGTHREIMGMDGAKYNLSNYELNKSTGNWTAARRRKLIRCPCGAFFCNNAARAQGLYSESEWARKGYPYFKSRERYYLDLETARKKCRFGILQPNGDFVPYTHLRKGPQPAARIWRAFYDYKSKRWEFGVHSVDLFSADQVDLTRFRLSNRQTIALIDGDKEVAELLKKHWKPKRPRPKKFDPELEAQKYYEETGFRKPKVRPPKQK